MDEETGRSLPLNVKREILPSATALFVVMFSVEPEASKSRVEVLLIVDKNKRFWISSRDATDVYGLVQVDEMILNRTMLVLCLVDWMG